MNLYCLDKTNIRNYKLWLNKIKEYGGIGLFDKKTGWSSFDVVAKVKNLTGIKKVGHCGSLDPLATGLLILCFNKGTKHVVELMNERKHYWGIIKLGAVTETDDREGNEIVVESKDWREESDDFIIKKLEIIREKFVGKIQQFPPVYSAKKIKGNRLYKLARTGKLKSKEWETGNGFVRIDNIENIEKKITIFGQNEFRITPSEVEIYSLKFINFNKPFLEIEIICSKGTYIRSLARDLGRETGYGGYLYDLRRLAIGTYSVENAIKIDEFEKAVIENRI